MPSDNKESIDSSDKKEIPLADKNLLWGTVDSVFKVISVIFAVLPIPLVQVAVIILANEIVLPDIILFTLGPAFLILLILSSIFALESWSWPMNPTSSRFPILISTVFSLFLAFLITDFDRRCPQNMPSVLVDFIQIFKLFIIPSFILITIIYAFASHKANKLIIPVPEKEPKPNLLPEQKLFWGTVENVFERIAILFGILIVMKVCPFTYAVIQNLINVWNGIVVMGNHNDDVVGIFGSMSFVYWGIIAGITLTTPDFLFNQLDLLLFSTIYCSCGYSILLYNFYQTTRDMEFVHLSFAYTVFWITTPLLLLTSAFCAFALYKTRKIKIPRFYDGPDLYEVINDAENSSTKWTRKKLKSD